ncbi:phage minor tail protein [Streptococcus pneumoniae]|nr:phage minor tail protein [Streptococcus pneumoniae]
MSGLFQAVMPIVSGVTEIAFSLIKAAVKIGGSVIEGVVKAVSNLFNGEWKAAFDAACQIAVDIWNIIVDTFKGIDLFQIGKDIINGLIDGISSMASAAWDAVGNIAGGIKDAVTGFFDIHSPSRLMIELGGFITEGLGLGMEKNTDMAVNSAVNVSEKTHAPFATAAKSEEQNVPFATEVKGTSYKSNTNQTTNASSTKNEFHIHISGGTAKDMNENEDTFTEVAEKVINYIADKLDDASTGKTKVNLGVMES